MAISLSTSIHIPSGVFFKSHANHHLEACQQDIGHCNQEENPEEPP